MLRLLVDEDADVERIAIYHEVNGEWELVEESTIDEDGFITAPVSTFSKYGVFAKLDEPEEPADPEEPTGPEEPETPPVDESEGDEGTGLPLPKTASPYYTLLLIGLTLFAIGGLSFTLMRRRNLN